MTIQETSINIIYKRIEGIKRAYYQNEELLKEFFNEASVLAIPDDAPSEIPRIVVKTLHEHSELSISPTTASFRIVFNDGFEKDWRKCAQYIRERLKPVFQFLNVMTSNQYDYIGIITKVLYDEIGEDGSKKLTDTLLKADDIKDIYDINIRYTFVEKENFFVNIMLENARLFPENTDYSIAGSLNMNDQIKESIGAIIDVNDRKGFNEKLDYKSSSNIMSDLLESMTTIIDSKLSNLIENGVFE